MYRQSMAGSRCGSSAANTGLRPVYNSMSITRPHRNGLMNPSTQSRPKDKSPGTRILLAVTWILVACVMGVVTIAYWGYIGIAAGILIPLVGIGMVLRSLFRELGGKRDSYVVSHVGLSNIPQKPWKFRHFSTPNPFDDRDEDEAGPKINSRDSMKISHSITLTPIDGRMEIAYFTFPDHEGRGLATTMATELVAIAKSHDPAVLIAAQTLPERNASHRILEELGFTHFATLDHPETGEVWEWQLPDQPCGSAMRSTPPRTCSTTSTARSSIRCGARRARPTRGRRRGSTGPARAAGVGPTPGSMSSSSFCLGPSERLQPHPW